VDAKKIEKLRRGECPIYEPGLEDLMERSTKAGRLTFTLDQAAAYEQAEMIFICVGTPSDERGHSDLRYVNQAADDIADVLKRLGPGQRPKTIVMKSTVPVGTTFAVRDRIRARVGPTIPFRVADNPEFLKEGDAINDFMNPDRIVLGCAEKDGFARELMNRLYHPVSLSDNKIVWMDPASAEITKYVANTMLAMRISFMNEIAALCEAVGADIHSVRHGVGRDERIGPKFLYAGPGYGGSCFPKDVKALVQTAREHGLEIELAAATDRVNQRQKSALVRKVRSALGGDVRDKRVAIWGLSFKPRTDDVRESPALTLIDALLADGAQVAAHDPEAMDAVRKSYGERIALVEHAYDACKGADVLVLVTEWREYQNPNFRRIRDALKSPVIVDGRNIWSSYRLSAQGFDYRGIGVNAQ
jgi:UDPglucose 6-dehydrogenase